MSHFYSTIKGNRGTANRCGSKDSGIMAAAQSWHGSVIVRLTYNEETGCDMVDIEISDESSTHGKSVFFGTFEELEKKLIG